MLSGRGGQPRGHRDPGEGGRGGDVVGCDCRVGCLLRVGARCVGVLRGCVRVREEAPGAWLRTRRRRRRRRRRSAGARLLCGGALGCGVSAARPGSATKPHASAALPDRPTMSLSRVALLGLLSLLALSLCTANEYDHRVFIHASPLPTCLPAAWIASSLVSSLFLSTPLLKALFHVQFLAPTLQGFVRRPALILGRLLLSIGRGGSFLDVPLCRYIHSAPGRGRLTFAGGGISFALRPRCQLPVAAVAQTGQCA